MRSSCPIRRGGGAAGGPYRPEPRPAPDARVEDAYLKEAGRDEAKPGRPGPGTSAVRPGRPRAESWTPDEATDTLYRMSVLALLVGAGTFLAVLAAALLLRRLPSGRYCPGCGEATVPLRPGVWTRLIRPRIHVRWCPACGWSGLRRRRPPVGPSGRPPAHESGFKWARPDLSDAPLFVWRDRGRAGPRESGDEAAERPDPAHPSGFRWRRDPDPDAPAFHWGEEEDETPDE